MQRILDTTEEALGRAFRNLAENSRRERKVFYAGAWALGAIIVVATLMGLAIGIRGFVEGKHDQLISQAAAADLFVRREDSLIRHTEMTFRHDWSDETQETDTSPAPRPSTSSRYTIVTPSSVSTADAPLWNMRIRKLAHTLTSSIDAATALKAYSQIAIIGVDPSFAAYFQPQPPDATAASRQAASSDALIARMSAPFSRIELPHGAAGEPTLPLWLGPMPDPGSGRDVMHGAVAFHGSGEVHAIIAATVPVAEFLPALPAPATGEALFLLGRDSRLITASSFAGQAVRHAAAKRIRSGGSAIPWGATGLILTAPLSAGFGTLVYSLSYPAALSEMQTLLFSVLGTAGALLIILVAGLRYCDRHLLRHNHSEAARALENETLNHILVSATPVGLMIVARPELDLLMINTLALSLLGMRTPDKLPPALAADFLTNTENDRGVSAFARIYQFEHCVGRSEPRRTLHITYAPAQYKRQNVLFCAITEVTVQKNIEAELRSARIASERLVQTRSHFFASMNHEIRTPLHVLLGNLELFAGSAALTAEHRSRLATLDTAAQNLLRISNDILDLSKLAAGEMKLLPADFSPAQAFENFAQAHAPLATSRGLHFHLALDPACFCVLHGDVARIGQIVHNLLANAIKFTHTGKIMLGVRVIAGEDAAGGGPALAACVPVQDAAALPACQLQIDVLDSGIGVAAETQSRLFAPFQQGAADTFREYGGTGLGLSICAQLCRIMNGSIELASVQGVGSRFTVRLPAAVVSAAPVQARGVARPVAALCSKAYDYRDNIGAWLEHAGYAVHHLNRLASDDILRQVGAAVIVVTDDFPVPQRAKLGQTASLPVIEVVQDAGIASDAPGAAMPAVIPAWRPSMLLRALEASASASPVPRQTGSPAAESAESAQNEASPACDFIVVDDCALSRQLLCEQLASAGYRARAHGDGQSALAQLARCLPRAILTDLDMPVMSGSALLQRVQAHYPGLPVIAVSASTQDDEVAAGLELGFFDYLGKPVLKRQLAALLDRLSQRDMETAVFPADSSSESGLSADFLRKRWSYFDALLPAELDALEHALSAKNIGPLLAWLHKMRGALGVLDEPGLGARCLALETQSQHTDQLDESVRREAQHIAQAIASVNLEHNIASGDTACDRALP